MNSLKKTLALMATLVMAASAFVACGGDESSSSSESSSSEASGNESSATEAESSGDSESESSSESEATGEKSTEVGEVKLGTGGDTFTVASWDANDFPAMREVWKKDNADADAKVNFVCFNCGGGEAAEKYDQLFSGGEDLDLYFVEADWALKYINDDTKTAPLSDLGFTDENFAEIYPYTDEIGKDQNGVRKGVSWQAAGGGFAYRSDLAKEYLGVEDPDAMQEQVKDWDTFVATAKTVNEKSGGKSALADSIGGLWQAYAPSRTTPWVVDEKVELDDFCKTFADTAKSLWDSGGVTKINQWDEAWVAAGTDGTTMGYFVSTWGFGETAFFMNATGGKDGAGGDKNSYGLWNVCQGPSKYYWGGTWYVVNPKTDNAEECQSVIKTFTVDNDKISEYAKAKPEFCNNSTVMDELLGADTVFNQTVTDNVGGQNFYKILAESATDVNLNGLITPYDATIKSTFLSSVQDVYLNGGEDWDAVVEDFKNDGSEALPDLNWD